MKKPSAPPARPPSSMQVDPNLDVVKGRGGALLREKMVEMVSMTNSCVLLACIWNDDALGRRHREHTFSAEHEDGGLGQHHGACRPPSLLCAQAAVSPPCSLNNLHPPKPPSSHAQASDIFVCIVDDSKMVSGLGGSKLAMPIEITQFCHLYTLQVGPGGCMGWSAWKVNGRP